MKNKFSIILSMALCAIFAVICIVLLVQAPCVIEAFVEFRHIPDTSNILLTTLYFSCVMVLIALGCMTALLYNLLRKKVFIKSNCNLIRTIAYLCVGVGICAAYAAFSFYLSFIVISLGAFFLALVLRVVRGIFTSAIAYKEESELTI